MSRLTFDIQARPIAADPARADIACFVGFVARRESDLPRRMVDWLTERRWDEYTNDLSALLDIPIPIDSWDLFDALFAWESRPLVDGSSETAATYLGAAVRSFFHQGGRKCVVIRTGEPWSLLENSTAAERGSLIRTRLETLIPQLVSGNDLSAADPESWSGCGHLFGLPEVSTLCLPDLPDIVGTRPLAREFFAPPTFPVQWVPCSEEPESSDEDTPAFRARRVDATGLRNWSHAVGTTGEFLRRTAREVALVAALPLIDSQLLPDAESDPLAFLLDNGQGPLARPVSDTTVPWPVVDDGVNEPVRGIGSAFVQIVAPWLATSSSRDLPDSLEPPDGALAGLLARNALNEGSFRNAARLRPNEIIRTVPEYTDQQRLRRLPLHAAANGIELQGVERSLDERVTLFGRTPDAMRLLSDVSTSVDDSYRQAGVGRLMSAILRAARRLGNGIVFEPVSQQLWTHIEDSMTQLLTVLYQAGALRGATQTDAFTVRCGRDTMSQTDIEQGRVITEVEFTPASSIEAIRMLLAFNDAGQVSVVQSKSTAREAA